MQNTKKFLHIIFGAKLFIQKASVYIYSATIFTYYRLFLGFNYVSFLFKL